MQSGCKTEFHDGVSKSEERGVASASGNTIFGASGSLRAWTLRKTGFGGRRCRPSRVADQGSAVRREGIL